VKPLRSETLLFGSLSAVGFVLYALRWALFPGALLHSEMWRFLLGDVAFLFLQIAFVTLFVDRLLRERERRALLRKLNMVIGAFFSEVGNDLLAAVAASDRDLEQVRAALIPSGAWTAASYARAERALQAHAPAIDEGRCDLHALKAQLVRAKPFLLGLLGNQALLEHERFTDLLWAITHLAEELEARPGLDGLPATDVAHLAGDVARAYSLLVVEWLRYMAHMQDQYPFLFSLAARRNPFDPQATPIVTR
jgi:hypothetical protein